MNNGSIPQEAINAVLQHYDIVETVGKYVPLSKQGKNFIGLCPFHSEKSPSFSVSPDKQIFHCFGCGAGGNAIKFMMEIEGYSFPEAVRTMAEDAQMPVTWEEISQEKTGKALEREQMVNAHELAAKWFHYLLKNSETGKQAALYLRGRGFNDKIIDTFQIGYAPPMWDTLTQFLIKREFNPALMTQAGLIAHKDGGGYYDLFRDRIMFPIWDGRGRVVAFSGRVIHEGQPKYLNTPGTPIFYKSKQLYNFHQAKQSIQKTTQAVLFEGYVDVIKAWEAGCLNGVATMGTALTQEHAAILKRSAEQVVVCYDGDNAGQSAAFKSIDILEKESLSVKIAVLPGKMDPDEYISANGADSFRREILDSAVSATRFKLIYLRRQYNLSDEDDRLRYIHEALLVVAALSSPTERDYYIKDLSNEFSVTLDALKQEMHQIRQEMQKNEPSGDKMPFSWNNVMNDRSGVQRQPVLVPAYQNAEKKLLAIMMHDREVAFYVQKELGDEFNVEAHAALAAYLYTYYGQGNEPDASRYISFLQNDELESLASSISMMDANQGVNEQVIDDYLREIRKYPRMLEIEQRKEERNRVERSGDVIRAAQLANEIIALERQLKLL